MTRINYEMALTRQAELQRQATARRRGEHLPEGDAFVGHPTRRWNPLARRPVALLRLVSHS